jgi:hypothetical protein
MEPVNVCGDRLRRLKIAVGLHEEHISKLDEYYRNRQTCDAQTREITVLKQKNEQEKLTASKRIQALLESQDDTNRKLGTLTLDRDTHASNHRKTNEELQKATALHQEAQVAYQEAVVTYDKLLEKQEAENQITVSDLNQQLATAAQQITAEQGSLQSVTNSLGETQTKLDDCVLKSEELDQARLDATKLYTTFQASTTENNKQPQTALERQLALVEDLQEELEAEQLVLARTTGERDRCTDKSQKLTDEMKRLKSDCASRVEKLTTQISTDTAAANTTLEQLVSTTGTTRQLLQSQFDEQFAELTKIKLELNTTQQELESAIARDAINVQVLADLEITRLDLAGKTSSELEHVKSECTARIEKLTEKMQLETDTLRQTLDAVRVSTGSDRNQLQGRFEAEVEALTSTKAELLRAKNELAVLGDHVADQDKTIDGLEQARIDTDKQNSSERERLTIEYTARIEKLTEKMQLGTGEAQQTLDALRVSTSSNRSELQGRYDEQFQSLTATNLALDNAQQELVYAGEREVANTQELANIEQARISLAESTRLELERVESKFSKRVGELTEQLQLESDTAQQTLDALRASTSSDRAQLQGRFDAQIGTLTSTKADLDKAQHDLKVAGDRITGLDETIARLERERLALADQTRSEMKRVESECSARVANLEEHVKSEAERAEQTLATLQSNTGTDREQLQARFEAQVTSLVSTKGTLDKANRDLQISTDRISSQDEMIADREKTRIAVGERTRLEFERVNGECATRVEGLEKRITDEAARAEQTLAALRSSTTSTRQGLEERLDNQLVALEGSQEELDAATRQLELAGGEIEAYKVRIKQQTEEKTVTAENTRRELERVNGECATRVEGLEKRITDEAARAEQTLEELRSSTTLTRQGLEKRLDKQLVALEESQEELDAAKRQFELAGGEIEAYKARIKQQTEEKTAIAKQTRIDQEFQESTAKEANEALLSTIEQHTARFDKSQLVLKDAQQAVTDKAATLGQCVIAKDLLEDEVRDRSFEYNETIGYKEKTIKELEATIERLNEENGQIVVLQRQLMTIQNKIAKDAPLLANTKKWKRLHDKSKTIQKGKTDCEQKLFNSKARATTAAKSCKIAIEKGVEYDTLVKRQNAKAVQLARIRTTVNVERLAVTNTLSEAIDYAEGSFVTVETLRQKLVGIQQSLERYSNAASQAQDV